MDIIRVEFAAGSMWDHEDTLVALLTESDGRSVRTYNLSSPTFNGTT